jgi:putative peptide zinc metalloprotease protein
MDRVVNAGTLADPPGTSPAEPAKVMRMVAAAAAQPKVLAPPQAQPAPRLPALREELRLIPAAPHADGSPAWMVHDPVVNRFYRIGWLDFELLLRWGDGSAQHALASIAAETTLAADETDIAALIGFLTQHSLLKADSMQAVDQLRARAAQQIKSPFDWLLHNYLFFRLPLLRPQWFLVRMLAVLGWVFSRTTATAVLGLSAAGVFLAARQWETFASTFVDQLSWSGLLGYTCALACAKALHELGHALTATRYGVRVAHMGVAFLVMFPMLYTDTSESWKLTKPRQRLAIASAGIVVELALAGLATLAWSLAPDGALKSAMFFLATTSWILTLAVNASPFMRFDGYFIAMDIFDFPNLHERSGALARAWMRRTLLGWHEAAPERFSARTNAVLIGFALFTWVYRLTVFLGIAFLVYHYAFKLLGIFLMLVELVWFVARPFITELRVWNERKNEITANRRGWWAGAAMLLAGATLLPWQGSVHGPGWVHAQQQQVIYAPLAGRLLSLPTSTSAAAGQALFVLASPDLNQNRDRAQGLANARAQELLGLAGLPDGEERRTQVQGQQDKYAAEARMYEDESARLQIAAPFAGEVADIDPQLAPGVWVQPRQPLATVVDPSRWVVEAFVAEADIARVRAGQSASVRTTQQGLGVMHGHVIEVDANRTATLPHAMLDAQSGGPVITLPPAKTEHRTGAVASDATQAPRDALYRVKIALDEAPHQRQMAVGRVVIDSDRQAWFTSAFANVASLFVREGGF